MKGPRADFLKCVEAQYLHFNIILFCFLFGVCAEILKDVIFEFSEIPEFSTMLCHNCNQRGHLTYDCPDRFGERARGDAANDGKLNFEFFT